MATRKKVVTSSQDLNQLKNLFGESSIGSASAEPVINEQIETVATPEFQTQQEVPVEKTESRAEWHQLVNEPNVITEEKQGVSDTTVGIRMTTAKKREMKAYFIQHGTTMSQGVIDAFALLKMLEDEGVVAYKDGILERV